MAASSPRNDLVKIYRCTDSLVDLFTGRAGVELRVLLHLRGRALLVRFSMQQAVLLDIALIFPQLFQSIFGATNIKVPEALVEPASSFVFFFIFLASVYSCGSNILGKQPNQIPIISSAAEQSIGPF